MKTPIYISLLCSSKFISTNCIINQCILQNLSLQKCPKPCHCISPQ
jgi:hypothetical protein